MIQRSQPESKDGGRGRTSRRALLGAAMLLAARAGLQARARPPRTTPAPRPQLLYIGAYSSQDGPPELRGCGEGIYLFQIRASAAVRSAPIPSTAPAAGWRC